MALDNQIDMMMMQIPESSSPQGNKELTNFQTPSFSSESTTTTTNIINSTKTTMPIPNLSLDDNFPLIPLLSSSSPYTNINHVLHLPSSAATNFTNNNHPSATSPTIISNNYGKVSSGKQNSMDSMREMIFRIASMQPIYIDPESVKPPKRRNVKVSKDPQSIAARHRRERISQRIRILQRLVPGGTKMDTASMLDEAIHYVKFLKKQVQSLERFAEAKTSRFL